MIKACHTFLWAEVVHTDVYILNRSPTKAFDNLTPFEAYSGRKPGIGHLKVFGSICYMHVPSETRQKLDAKSVKVCLWDMLHVRKDTGYLIHTLRS